jgi:hypothetical protein
VVREVVYRTWSNVRKLKIEEPNLVRGSLGARPSLAGRTNFIPLVAESTSTASTTVLAEDSDF